MSVRSTRPKARKICGVHRNTHIRMCAVYCMQCELIASLGPTIVRHTKHKEAMRSTGLYKIASDVWLAEPLPQRLGLHSLPAGALFACG